MEGKAWQYGGVVGLSSCKKIFKCKTNSQSQLLLLCEEKNCKKCVKTQVNFWHQMHCAQKDQKLINISRIMYLNSTITIYLCRELFCQILSISMRTIKFRKEYIDDAIVVNFEMFNHHYSILTKPLQLLFSVLAMLMQVNTRISSWLIYVSTLHASK